MRQFLSKVDWRVAAALGTTYLLFGSGPAAASMAIKTLPPFLTVALRGLLAGAILTVWAVCSGASWPTWREWRSGTLVGVLILTLGAGSGIYGQRTVPSGIVGVLSALLPMFAACVGFVAFRERLPRRGLLGLAIGFAGVALLLRPGSDLDLFGVAAIVAGLLAWAIGTELAPRVGLPDDPRLAAGLELLAGGSALVVVALLMGDWARLDLGSASLASWTGFAWFVVIAVGGFTAFGYLTQTVSPSLATTFSYVNPVVATGLGWLLFGEPVTWRTGLAIAVIVVGVCLIVSTKGGEDEKKPAKVRHPFTSGHGHGRRKAVAPSQPAPADVDGSG